MREAGETSAYRQCGSVRAWIRVACCRTGLRGIGVCWLRDCGIGGIARTDGVGRCTAVAVAVVLRWRARRVWLGDEDIPLKLALRLIRRLFVLDITAVDTFVGNSGILVG